MNTDWYYKCADCEKKANFNTVDGDTLQIGRDGWELIATCPHCGYHNLLRLEIAEVR